MKVFSLLTLAVVLLQWSGARSQPPPRTETMLTHSQRAKLLNAHNTIRSEVSPPAADMLKLSWNDALASVAQDHADRCTWHYNDERTMASRNLGLQYAYVGENVFISAAELDLALERAMASWVGEEVNYDRTSNKCKANQLCSHYKQIVWSKTQQVGCGVATCPSVQGLPSWQHTSTVLVCNYAIGGLMPANSVPYARGERCSLCPTTAPNCENGALCVSGIPATPAPATSSEQAISGPTPAAGATQGPVPSGQSNLTEPSTVGPSQFPQDPQPNVGAPLDPVQSTLNPVRGPLKVIPDLPTVPSAVFMLEFERRFKNLEKSFKALVTQNDKLKQDLEARTQTFSKFKLETERALGTFDPSTANKHSRASAHLETPSSGVLTMLPGAIITRFDMKTNETKLIGGFKLTRQGSLEVPETGNYFVYAQVTSMQWGQSSIRITRNRDVIARASSSYGFQESAYAGKLVTLRKGDTLTLSLGKGSKLYRSGPGETYFGAFLL